MDTLATAKSAEAQLLPRAAALYRRDLIAEPLENGRDRDTAAKLLACWDPIRRHHFIYKERRLTPPELVEIERVLGVLQGLRCASLCPVVAYAVRDHRLNLLLGRVPGQSFDHGHDAAWRNLPSFSLMLSTLSHAARIRISIEVASALTCIHEAGLLYQDLRIEQLMLTPSGGVVMLDLDTIILEHGYCARSPQWAFHGSPLNDQAASRTTDLYCLGLLLYELFYDRHWWFDPKEIKLNPDVDPVIYGLLCRPQDTDSGTVLAALSGAAL